VAALQDQFDRVWVEAMFHFEDSCRQRVGGIAGQDRHFALQHHGAGIEFLVHEMNSGAADGRMVVQGLLLRVKAGVFRQQRRMDVEDSLWKRVDEHRAQQAHEAGQADQRHLPGL